MNKKDWMLWAVIVVIDQLAKIYIASVMKLGQSIEVIDGFFYITFVRNTGAAWSLFSALSMRWVFVIMAIAVCVVIYRYLMRNSCRPLTKASLVMIMGGSIGNMLDRAVTGSVVDFLHFFIFGYDFPVFNIADCFLSVGTALLVVAIMVEKEPKKKDE